MRLRHLLWFPPAVAVLLFACAHQAAAPEPAAAPPAHVLGDCHPTPGAEGNSKHVGAYCTKGGGECARFSSGARKCAADLDARGGDFCVKIFCSKDEDCGEGAVCYGDPHALGKACIPAGCVADGGVRAP